MTNLDWAKLGFMTAGISRDGQVRGIPLLGEEGWLRHQENAATFEGADGVVAHTPCF